MSGVVYLAHPMDQVTDNEEYGRLSHTLDLVRAACHTHGLTVYSPGRAFNRGMDHAEQRDKINRLVLAECDGLIAVLPKDVVTYGVPMEIEQAQSSQMPLVVLCDKPSVALINQSSWPLSDPYRAVDALCDAIEPRTPTIKVKSLESDTRLPSRAHHNDCGFDLHVIGTHHLPADPTVAVDIPCGIAVELPHDAWGLVVGRSSTIRKRGLDVRLGVLDAGYRGPLFTAVTNVSGKPVTVEHGDRLAQLIPLPTMAMGWDIQWVTALSESARGAAGFGSSGT